MSVRRSLAWAFSGQIVAFSIQFAGLIIISRLLSPREVGIYAIAVAALGITQVFTTFGISSFLVRETELPRGTLESAFTLNAMLLVGLSALLVGTSFVAGPLLGAREAGSVLRVIAISNLFAILNLRPAAMLQREMHFKQLTVINVLGIGTQTSGTILFALHGASYMSAAYGALAAMTVTTAATQFFGRRHIGFGLSLKSWRPITSFGLHMMSVSGIAMLNGRLSDLLVGRLLGIAPLGYYGRASQLSAIIFDNLYGTATRVVFVQLSKDYREGGDWRRTFLRSFAMINAFMWPLLIGLAILANPVVRLLYGEKWLPVAGPLAALMISQAVGVAFGMNWELFVLRRETGRQARLETSRFLIGIPIFAVACLFSIVWAAIAKVADAAIGFMLYQRHVRRLTGLGASDFKAVYRQTALLAACAVLPATAAMIFYDWSPYTPLWVVGAAVIAGLALWLGALILIRHPLYDELRIVSARLRAAIPRASAGAS